MPKATYSFPTVNMDELAERLSELTGVRLHAAFSPMDGPWYSSFDDSLLLAAYGREDKAVIESLTSASKDQPQLTLKLNGNGDLYNDDAEYPDYGDCLLFAEADSAWLHELADKLTNSELSYEEIK